MPARLFISPHASARIGAAAAWFEEQGAARELVVVGATREAVGQLVRGVAMKLGGGFGWQRVTLRRLAAQIAEPALVEEGRVPVSALSLEALAARMVHGRLAEGTMGRFAPIANRPGFPRALARTLDELRLEGVTPEELSDPDLGALLAAFGRELEKAGLADRAFVLERAGRRAAGGEASTLADVPLLVLDVPIASALERELVRALIARSPSALLTVPEGDERTLAHLHGSIGAAAVERAPASEAKTRLERLQAGLFSATVSQGASASPESVVVLSAPGESRECVEQSPAASSGRPSAGSPSNRMAVVLRSPEEYQSHLVEALRRAKVPAYFARGTRRPHSAGRAFVALLACAEEGLCGEALCRIPLSGRAAERVAASRCAATAWAGRRELRRSRRRGGAVAGGR